MKTSFRLLYIIALLLTVVSCGRRAPQSAARPERRYVFLPPIPPAALPQEQKRDYLREHYWDKFDFADTMFVHKADTAQMLSHFAQFVAVISDRPADPAPMADLMRRAGVSRPMTDYFVWLAERVLADPNSSMRNDEFYIPVLEAQLAAPFYDQYERIGPQYALDMARQNRIGQRANDFRYTLESGVSRRLYDLRAEYVLLFINNPGCPMCREIHEAIEISPVLRRLIADGRLKVLAFYPDEDLGEWLAYRGHVPASWINSYDKGCVVRETSAYNLSAIPALYLLDRDKRVLVKDATDVGLVEEAVLAREQL
ncbi:DUF5106 domain-containing protein [uncultured Alistipes sp.]|uniref:DUF5106 domain-containing protein n=1 Tax=uncultured Alistipes sp. TaxID=538949 RepID=UPI0032205AA2